MSRFSLTQITVPGGAGRAVPASPGARATPNQVMGRCGAGGARSHRDLGSVRRFAEPCRVQELLALSLIEYLELKCLLYVWDLNSI